MSQHNTKCDLHRADKFLNSDHYRMEDKELISHLDGCSSCREYLDSQAAGTDLWNKLSSHLKPAEFDAAGIPDYSAATMVGRQQNQSAAVQEVLDSLSPTDQPHHLGRLGTYEVTGVVGVGGMGVVLKAVDPSLDRVVALKLMAPRLANNELARRRFSREAKAAAAVLHPNVIPIHSVSSESKLPYLVMTYVRGGSLQKRLKEEGSLSLLEMLRIGSQIAAGLEAAHEKGLVHRDIKPENVLLEEGVERVTITDFGLARAVDDNTMTQQGTIAGTPMYMSPEQAQGEQVDQQSDLFSLGSVLYALSTGNPPFRADTSYGVMRRIIDEQPVPIQQSNPDIPGWFAEIIVRLMAKDKAERFASAAEVHKLLDACLSHLQQPDRMSLPIMDKSKNGRRNRSFFKSWQGASLFVAAAVVSMMAVWAWQPSPSPQLEVTQTLKSAEFDMPSVNAELAERLVGRKESLTFTKVVDIYSDTAAILATHPENLSFPSVRQISPEVASELAKKDTLWLVLDGLPGISTDVAHELSRAKCGLKLEGLKAITPAVAAHLAEKEGAMNLGIISPSPEVATALSQHSGWLSLNGIRTLDSTTADALVKHGGQLSLNGLTSLSTEVAESLSQFEGETLDLCGLSSLDADVARKLASAKCSNSLTLNGLTTISPEVLAVLANGNYSLSLQGLEHVDDELVKALEVARAKLFQARKLLLVNQTTSKQLSSIEVQ